MSELRPLVRVVRELPARIIFTVLLVLQRARLEHTLTPMFAKFARLQVSVPSVLVQMERPAQLVCLIIS